MAQCVCFSQPVLLEQGKQSVVEDMYAMVWYGVVEEMYGMVWCGVVEDMRGGLVWCRLEEEA